MSQRGGVVGSGLALYARDGGLTPTQISGSTAPKSFASSELRELVPKLHCGTRYPSWIVGRPQASPDHISSCLGLIRQDLVQDPLLVLNFLRVNGRMDLI
ncbi:hypothetical protein TNCV_3853761 [Trichonephila clavipes]|nr:hypothetical protein TNCV_3853761 [Trichonephila clavipes]